MVSRTIRDLLEQQLHEKNHELELRDETIRFYQKQLAAKDAQIGEKDKQINEKDQQIKEKDKQIQAKDEQLRERDNQLRLKDEQMRAKDSAFQARTKSYQGKIAQIQHRVHNGTVLAQSEIRRYKNEIALLKKDKAQLEIALEIALERVTREAN